MNLIGREALRFYRLYFRYKVFQFVVVLRAGIRGHFIPVCAKYAVHRQVHRFAKDVPKAVVDGGRIRELPAPALFRNPLRRDRWQIEYALAREQALAVLKPPQVTPVRMPVPTAERVVTFDAAVCHNRGNLRFALIAAAAGYDDVDFYLLNGEIG